MSTPEKMLGGDLYSDYREHETLAPSAQLKFTAYVDELKKLDTMLQEDPDTDKWINWENGLKNFYRLLVNDAFEELKIAYPEGMEIYFAGSLAKKQATQYSDLDAFVIFKNPEDAARTKPVFEALNNLCNRIYLEVNQLYPDPIGINPARLYGSVDQMLDKLKSDEIDVGPTLRSIYTSKPILGNFELGLKLRNEIKADPKLGKMISPELFYNKAITDYGPPKDTAQTVNIKSHLLRPLDFILLGLREEFDIYSEDGSHLSAQETIKALREHNLIDKETTDKISRVFNESMKLRFNAHKEAKREHDEIAKNKVNYLLEDIASLREMANQRVKNLQAKANENRPVDDKTAKKGNFFMRNKGLLLTLGLIAAGITLGVGVGLALAFTLAPLGAGILATVATTALAGAAGGILTGIGIGIVKLGQAVMNFLTSSFKSKEEAIVGEKQNSAQETSHLKLPCSHGKISKVIGGKSNTSSGLEESDEITETSVKEQEEKHQVQTDKMPPDGAGVSSSPRVF